MNEILIYCPLYDFTIAPIMKELDAVTSDFTVRMSCPGGEIFPSWGIAKKVRELSEQGFKSTLKIDGMSASMAGVLAPFFDITESVNVAKFMIHAPYGGNKEVLKSVAKDLLAVFKARIDSDKFKTIAGTTIEEVMDPENEERKDVWLSAKQAKEIGLINKVVKLTPALKNEIEDKMKVVYGFKEEPIFNQNPKEMTYDELKTSHPALFNQIFSEGQEAGKKIGIEAGKNEEQIRVKAWLAHVNSDTKKVVDGIKEGKELTADVREELFVAADLKKRTATKDNAGAADTSGEAGKEMDAALEEDVKSLK